MTAKHSDVEKLLLRELFDMYDKDKNEEITAEELRTKYAERGQPLSDTEVANIIGYFDTNSSDTVDFDEFCTYWSPKNKDAETKRSELTEAFQTQDKNGDGFIDVDEFLQIFHNFGFTYITRERAVTMLAKVDSDGDGKINLEEYLKTSS